MKKPYIGITKDGQWEGFRSSTTPTRESDGDHYVAVIGAFRTRRAQMWALKYGKNNPHFQTVNDAERISRIETITGGEYIPTESGRMENS